MKLLTLLTAIALLAGCTSPKPDEQTPPDTVVPDTCAKAIKDIDGDLCKATAITLNLTACTGLVAVLPKTTQSYAGPSEYTPQGRFGNQPEFFVVDFTCQEATVLNTSLGAIGVFAPGFSIEHEANGTTAYSEGIIIDNDHVSTILAWLGATVINGTVQTPTSTAMQQIAVQTPDQTLSGTAYMGLPNLLATRTYSFIQGTPDNETIVELVGDLAFNQGLGSTFTATGGILDAPTPSTGIADPFPTSNNSFNLTVRH